MSLFRKYFDVFLQNIIILDMILIRYDFVSLQIRRFHASHQDVKYHVRVIHIKSRNNDAVEIQIDLGTYNVFHVKAVHSFHVRSTRRLLVLRLKNRLVKSRKSIRYDPDVIGRVAQIIYSNRSHTVD